MSVTAIVLWMLSVYLAGQQAKAEESNTTNNNVSSGLSGGAIAGIVVGAVIAGILLILIIYKCCCWTRASTGQQAQAAKSNINHDKDVSIGLIRCSIMGITVLVLTAGGVKSVVGCYCDCKKTKVSPSVA